MQNYSAWCWNSGTVSISDIILAEKESDCIRGLVNFKTPITGQHLGKAEEANETNLIDNNKDLELYSDDIDDIWKIWTL